MLSFSCAPVSCTDLKKKIFNVHFIFFLLPVWLVRLLLWNVVWDKRRSRNSLTSWRGLTLSPSFPSHPICILFSLLLHSKPVFPLFASLAFSLSLTPSFTLSGCCTLMWCWPRYSLPCLLLHIHTHTPTQMHTTSLYSLTRTTQSVLCTIWNTRPGFLTSRNVWESPLWLPL